MPQLSAAEEYFERGFFGALLGSLHVGTYGPAIGLSFAVPLALLLRYRGVAARIADECAISTALVATYVACTISGILTRDPLALGTGCVCIIVLWTFGFLAYERWRWILYPRCYLKTDIPEVA